MNDFDKIDLKNASILDFTEDLELMRRVLDDVTFETSDVSSWGSEMKMHSIFEFALFTDNTQLLDKLEREFAQELDALYNE